MAVSASVFIVCGLLGKAEFFRFFLGGEIWVMWRAFAHGLHLYAPIYALVYFCGMSLSQHLDHQFMFYNFCGILLFGTIFGVLLYGTIVERPFISALLLKHELQLINANLNMHPETAFNIEHYKKGVAVGGGDNEPEEKFLFQSENSIPKRVNEGTTLFEISQSAERTKD